MAKTFLIYPYWNVNIPENKLPTFIIYVSNLSILECKLYHIQEKKNVNLSF